MQREFQRRLFDFLNRWFTQNKGHPLFLRMIELFVFWVFVFCTEASLFFHKKLQWGIQ